MATGDVVVFNESKAYLLEQSWAPTDSINIAICDNTTAPTAAHVTPLLADFTQVTAAGTYTTGGLLLDTLGDMVTESSGTVTFDTTGTSDNETPTWAADASNASSATLWGIIYNDTDASNRCICYIELGTVDMSTSALTITFHANGIFTFA